MIAPWKSATIGRQRHSRKYGPPAAVPLMMLWRCDVDVNRSLPATDPTPSVVGRNLSRLGSIARVDRPSATITPPSTRPLGRDRAMHGPAGSTERPCIGSRAHACPRPISRHDQFRHPPNLDPAASSTRWPIRTRSDHAHPATPGVQFLGVQDEDPAGNEECHADHRIATIGTLQLRTRQRSPEDECYGRCRLERLDPGHRPGSGRGTHCGGLNRP